MEKLISIKDLNVKKVLNNISLSFYDGVSTFICGTSGSGKTTLLKAIAKKVKYEGAIDFKNKVSVLLDKNYFSTSLVEDEIRYVYLNEREKKFVSNFFSSNELKLEPNSLSFYKQKLLILCSFLYQKSKIVFIDNLFSFINDEDKNKFLDYFKKNKITVVVVSNNIEEALNYDYMIVMNEGIVAMEGKTSQVLKEEKLLKRLGIGLPFYIDLCIQLKCYGLIDEIYLSKEELGKVLWS